MVSKWIPVTIGDIATFQGGSQPPLFTFSSSEKKNYVRLIQIRDYKTDKYLTFAPLHLCKRFCTKEDVMIGRYGPPIFQILRGLEGAYNVALIKAIPHHISSEYLFYTLKRKDIFSFVELLSRRSSGQTGVDLAGLKQFIAIPSDPREQKAIAEALSDIDHLIATTEKLIAKKKAIKQGLMQELLTGKHRLPGFTKPWKKTTLGACLAKIMGGGTPSRKIEEYWNGNIPWATVKDFSTYCPTATQERITSLGLANSASHLIPAGTLIIATRMNVGKVSIYDVDVAINQDLKALFPNRNICPKYLFFLLTFLQSKIEKLGTGSTVNGIRVEQLRNFEITLPSVLEEQKAIAGVLSDIDADIGKLLQKLNKLKQIRQGMMSELLTGRIRLSQK